MGLHKTIEIGTILKTKALYPCEDNVERMEQKELIVVEIFEEAKKTLNCLVLDGDCKQSPSEVYLGGGRLVDLKLRFATLTVDEIKKNFLVCGKLEDNIIKDIIRFRELKNALENIQAKLHITS